MSQRFRVCDLNQPLLLPPSLQDWLPEGHLARFVRRDSRWTGSVGDLRRLSPERRQGIGRLPSGDDGAVAVVRLLCGGGEFAENRVPDARRCSLPILGRRAAPGSRYHRQLSSNAPAKSGGIVHAGLAVVRKGGAGETRSEERRVGKECR